MCPLYFDYECSYCNYTDVCLQARWFYNNLGIDDAYFAQGPIDTVVNHILSLYGAKVSAFARNDTNFEIRLDREEADHAVYIDTSEPGVSNLSGPQYEQRYPSPSEFFFLGFGGIPHIPPPHTPRPIASFLVHYVCLRMTANHVLQD